MRKRAYGGVLINCWSSVVASVVLPQLCNLHCLFFVVLDNHLLVQDLYSMSPKGYCT